MEMRDRDFSGFPKVRLSRARRRMSYRVEVAALLPKPRGKRGMELKARGWGSSPGVAYRQAVAKLEKLMEED